MGDVGNAGTVANRIWEAVKTAAYASKGSLKRIAGQDHLRGTKISLTIDPTTDGSYLEEAKLRFIKDNNGNIILKGSENVAFGKEEFSFIINPKTVTKIEIFQIDEEGSGISLTNLYLKVSANGKESRKNIFHRGDGPLGF